MKNPLKEAIAEFVDIVKGVPEPLQARCFEILLNNYLSSQLDHAKPEQKVEQKTKETPNDLKPAGSAADQSVSQADIQLTDLHVKAKRFLEKYQLSVADLNEIFFKEGEEIKPLFDDLKTTKLNESQIRIGLLQALKSGIRTGEFQFSGEEVRAECQLRKCYDVGNFSAYFKKSADLFDGFDGYQKASPIIRLSETGRKALADLIGDLKD